jgi:hypothetical protein
MNNPSNFWIRNGVVWIKIDNGMPLENGWLEYEINGKTDWARPGEWSDKKPIEGRFNPNPPGTDQPDE